MRVISAGDGYASQYSRIAHFGFGNAQSIDMLEITWPSGHKQTFRNVAVDRLIEVDENGPAPVVIR
jgi:hypothetical protein